MRNEERRGMTLQKSKNFAIKIVRLCQYLRSIKEYDIASQLIKSGTSIGANLTEASYAISKKDFYAKVYISLKECAETKFWLELLFDTTLITPECFEDIHTDCVELLRLLTSITRTLKDNLEKK